MATEHVIRASDADREHAVEALRSQYAEGRLTLGEFDERTSAAYAAKTWTALRELTVDLPVRLNFGSAPAVDTPGSGAPDEWWHRRYGIARQRRFAVLLPILFVWIVVASLGGWHHSSGHFFPFFPLIPLTIFGTMFALRWLVPGYLARQRRGGNPGN